MNTQELKEKADTLLALREDLYEMHFHQCDREWLIDAMIDFASMNHMYFGEKSGKPINLTEISDEEIEKAFTVGYGFQKTVYTDKIEGAKWYREQLKKKI